MTDKAQGAAIPTWQERFASAPARYVDSECRAMVAEIADLRAALKAQPAPTEAPITEQDVHDAASLAWGHALDDAAFYVAGHCANGEFHAETISTMRMPAIKFRGKEAPTEARPLHEEIVRKGDSLVCTACGTTKAAPTEAQGDEPSDTIKRIQRQNMQGMADCMDMVHGELIEAGIIDKKTPPMMITNAVCAYIQKVQAAQGEDSARLDIMIDWYLKEGPRAYFNPNGHITFTTKEMVIAKLDEAIAGASAETGGVK